MKAQLTMEYYASLIIFVLFVSYIFIRLSQISPQFITELKNERLRTESYKISEILVNDPGEPNKRIGFSSNLNKTNLLSKVKISSLDCSTQPRYEDVKRLLGTEYQFSIKVGNSTHELLTCEPRSEHIIKKLTKSSITRIIAFETGEFGKLTVEVW